MKKVVRRTILNKMPHDRWSDMHHCFYHATGYEVELDNGEVFIEYEDYAESGWYENTPDTIYDEEEDDEE